MSTRGDYKKREHGIQKKNIMVKTKQIRNQNTTWKITANTEMNNNVLRFQNQKYVINYNLLK